MSDDVSPRIWHGVIDPVDGEPVPSTTNSPLSASETIERLPTANEFRLGL